MMLKAGTTIEIRTPVKIDKDGFSGDEPFLYTLPREMTLGEARQNARWLCLHNQPQGGQQ